MSTHQHNNTDYKHVRVGVGGFITNPKYPHCVLLGKRLGNHGSNTYALPGGHLDYGETIAQCIEREIYEECNIYVKYKKTLNITENIFTDRHRHYITVFVLCDMIDTEQQIINAEPNKCEAWLWYEYNKLQLNTEQLHIFEPLQSFMNENTELDIFRQQSALGHTADHN